MRSVAQRLGAGEEIVERLVERAEQEAAIGTEAGVGRGVVIKPDTDDMSDVYGEGVTAKDVLKDNKVTAPAAIRAFPIMLGRYSTRLARN